MKPINMGLKPTLIVAILAEDIVVDPDVTLGKGAEMSYLQYFPAVEALPPRLTLLPTYVYMLPEIIDPLA